MRKHDAKKMGGDAHQGMDEPCWDGLKLPRDSLCRVIDVGVRDLLRLCLFALCAYTASYIDGVWAKPMQGAKRPVTPFQGSQRAVPSRSTWLMILAVTPSLAKPEACVMGYRKFSRVYGFNG